MLPLDCLGIVIEYLTSTSDFYKIFTLSKEVNQYIKDNPFLCRFLSFTMKKNINSIKKVKNYVYKLIIDNNKEISDSIFSNFTNVENLELIECPNIGHEGFKNFKKLRILRCDNCHEKYDNYKWNDEILYFVKNSLEVLELNNCYSFTNKGFEGLKLKKLILYYTPNIDDGIFSQKEELCKSLKNIKLEWCRNFKQEGLKLLKNIKKVSINNCNHLYDYQMSKVFENIVKKSKVDNEYKYKCVTVRQPRGDVMYDWELYNIIDNQKHFPESYKNDVAKRIYGNGWENKYKNLKERLRK